MEHIISRFPEWLDMFTPSDVPLSQLLNEIMPMIYKRFTEKAAEEWRQIYKVHLHPTCNNPTDH
jgi:hypothetical protein